MKDYLKYLNLACFFQTQIFILPVLLMFYHENGLTTGDFFLFQGLFYVIALLLELPSGYIGDNYPKKYVLIFSFSLFLTRIILWMLFKGFWIIFIGEVLYAANKAFFSGIADGYLYEYLQKNGKEKSMTKKYGKMNFFMSIGTVLASALGPVLYNHFGFTVLLGAELFVNVLAISLAAQLPTLPAVHKQEISLHDRFIELKQLLKHILNTPNLIWLMIYSGALAGFTLIFAWGFQPLMKAVFLPVSLFGAIYAINHGFRALAGILLKKMLSLIPLKPLALLNYFLYILSFCGVFLTLKSQNDVVTMICLTFICFTIGMQVAFTLGCTSYLHTVIPINFRATAISFNTVISRSFAGGLLVLFKFFIDDYTLQSSFSIYFSLFLLLAFPLVKVLRAKLN